MAEIGPFSTSVSAWAKKQKQSSTLIFREATKEVVREANTPQALGGNMPVRTGYLRASVRASLNRAPAVRSTNRPASERSRFPYNEGQINAVIDTAVFGKDTIKIAWTAGYARIKENETGFLRLAMQNWNSIVERVAKRVRQ